MDEDEQKGLLYDLMFVNEEKDKFQITITTLRQMQSPYFNTIIDDCEKDAAEINILMPSSICDIIFNNKRCNIISTDILTKLIFYCNKYIIDEVGVYLVANMDLYLEQFIFGKPYDKPFKNFNRTFLDNLLDINPLDQTSWQYILLEKYCFYIMFLGYFNGTRQIYENFIKIKHPVLEKLIWSRFDIIERAKIKAFSAKAQYNSNRQQEIYKLQKQKQKQLEEEEKLQKKKEKKLQKEKEKEKEREKEKEKEKQKEECKYDAPQREKMAEELLPNLNKEFAYKSTFFNSTYEIEKSLIMKKFVDIDIIEEFNMKLMDQSNFNFVEKQIIVPDCGICTIDHRGCCDFFFDDNYRTTWEYNCAMCCTYSMDCCLLCEFSCWSCSIKKEFHFPIFNALFHFFYKFFICLQTCSCRLHPILIRYKE